jgi:acyl-CoA hydrolase
VNFAGKSSMEVGIKVIAENIRTQEVRHVNSCFFTMVAVDDHGKAVAVPPLQPETDDEKRRFEAAQMRKQLRNELEHKFRQARQGGAA